MTLIKSETICISGPRPVKFDYSQRNIEKINTAFLNELGSSKKYNTILFGAAPGFDLVIAKLISDNFKYELENNIIKLVCVLPFENFSESHHFNRFWKSIYDNLINKCTLTVINNSENYYINCFRNRNYYMVDNSSKLICFYPNSKGGTMQTINYAKIKNIEIINLYSGDKFYE